MEKEIKKFKSFSQRDYEEGMEFLEYERNNAKDSI
jgi:hypothetical protein